MNTSLGLTPRRATATGLMAKCWYKVRRLLTWPYRMLEDACDLCDRR